MSGAGSAEESGILQQHGQGCVQGSQRLGDPDLPLSDPDWRVARSYIYEGRGSGFLRSSETSYYAS